VTNIFDYGDDQTPFTADDRLGLIPGHILTRSELDEFESQNITDAIAWLGRRRRRDPLSISFGREVHRQMYGDVWEWAGEYSREFDRTIGVDANVIEQELRVLVDNIRYRIDNDLVDDPIELIATFHHRLTQIHPFPNGNGRWTRLMTDLLAERVGASTINWGSADGHYSLHHTDAGIRQAYIGALRNADANHPEPLIDLLRAWSST